MCAANAKTQIIPSPFQKIPHPSPLLLATLPSTICKRFSQNPIISNPFLLGPASEMPQFLTRWTSLVRSEWKSW